MDEPFDLLLAGGACVTEGRVVETDVGVRGGRIAEIGNLSRASAARVLEVKGLHVLPGAIDTQVHFREPGTEHQEDWQTGSKAAVLGGVTSVFEMPNTIPTTADAATFADKTRRANAGSWCDFGLAVAGTPENADELPDLERLPGCPGVNVFLGSSTASVVVDEAKLRHVLASCGRRLTAHCEDEARVAERRAMVESGAPVALHAEWRDVDAAVIATRRFLALARAANKRVHVMNVTTADEILIIEANRELATFDVTPLHLTFAAPEAYTRLGSRVQTNPPVRTEVHRDALWAAIRDGLCDVIASDHSPHTLDEKARPYPESPSGTPGVQTLVPVMLDHVHAGRLSLARFVELVSAGPARVFEIVGKGQIECGYDADFAVVDLGAKRTIEDDWIASRVGWTPFAGMHVTGWPVYTVIRGNIVMAEDAAVGEPAGQPLRFEDVS
ncbi:MAG: dihydroorotase [Rhodospirillales bacterium]|nr:dihydroorotase [Rhodospirillales bacterium]MDP6804002.1 dihydroorotase [Rhodospirillales bacterium]